MRFGDHAAMRTINADNRMMIAAFISVVLACGVVSRARGEEPASAAAAKLEFVAELGPVEEIKLLGDKPSWTKEDDARFAGQIAAAREAWKVEATKIQKDVTPEKVRSLSRWAKPQMEKYNAVPRLDNVKTTAAGITADKKGIVFAGTIDTLPTHSTLVTRWLKVFFVYDLPTKSIRHATITIRGEVLE